MPELAPFHRAVLPGVALLLVTDGLAAEEREPGLRFDAAYIGEPIRNLRGGQRTGGTYLDNLDLQLAADPGSIFGIPGLSGLLYVLYNNANEFSAEYTGDAQIVSNIDAPRGLRLYEAWLDWAPGSGAVSARAGLYDLNSEFDVTPTAGLFINGDQGMGSDFGQTGRNGPSVFPVTSLALRLHARLGAGGYGQVAVLDGVPGDPDDPGSNRISLSGDDGALLVAEAGWGGGSWRKLAVGAWLYTADFERLTDPEGPPDDGNAGWYAIADRVVWQGESATVATFLRAGQAEDRYNPLGGYVGVGAAVAGFSARRPDDEFGIAAAIGITGRDFKRAREADGLPTDNHETSIELTYRAPVTGWLTLQPDLQYIINPGTDPALGNALVVSLRFELAFPAPLGGH